MGIGILTLFSQLFGLLNSSLGLTGDSRFSLGLGTVIVSHIAFSVPFVTFVVQARLQGFDKSFEEAAMDLGANEWTTFRRITFPMILPGILSGGLLAFTLSLDDFVITFFTNGPGSTTLADLRVWAVEEDHHAAGQRLIHGLDSDGVCRSIVVTGASKSRTETTLTQAWVLRGWTHPRCQDYQSSKGGRDE